MNPIKTAIATLLLSTTTMAAPSVDLELVGVETATVGDVITVEIWARPENVQPINVVEAILDWDTNALRLDAAESWESIAPRFLFNTNGPCNFNETEGDPEWAGYGYVTAAEIPTDGDALYLWAAWPGQHYQVSPHGIIMGQFTFTVVGSGETVVRIDPGEPPCQTRVASGFDLRALRDIIDLPIEILPARITPATRSEVAE